MDYGLIRKPAFMGNADIVALLIENGADLNAFNSYQATPLDSLKADWAIMERGEKKERGNPENLFVSQLMDEEVEKALRELPEEFRAAIVLVDIEELSYEVAAKVIGCPIGTVRSRVSRGRRLR